MTPAVWGFVLDSDTLAEDTGDDMLAAALDALTRGFAIATEHGAAGSGGRHRTWLDTFDWRLHNAGLVLEYEQSRRGGRLLLTRTDDTPVAEQPATGWQPRRPSLPAALPPGPVRDRVVALVSLRALLPIARADGAVAVTRLLNPDGKTVARLFVDRTTITAAATGPSAGGITMMSGAADVSLPPRLAVVPVRGYPGQARRAARLLAGVPGIVPADRSAFGEALAAIGRRPGDYSNKVRSEISGPTPAVVAVATILLGLLDTLEMNTPGVLRDIDTEFLHDLRVSVRRTRSAIKLLGDVLPSDLAKRFGAEFKWLGDMTTPTRDLDVHLLGFDPMARTLVAASPADLEPFRAFLLRRRSRAFRALVRVLRSERFHAISDDWRKALLELRDGRGPRGPRRRLTAADLAVDRTGRSFRRLAAQGAAITASSPPESLHDLRKRGKELRYLLEFFAPLHDPAAYRKVVGDLKQLQDGLGDFQDSQVQREEIQALAQQLLAERGGQQVCAATLLAMGEIAASLAVRQAQARADFGRRFAMFVGQESQCRFNVLLSDVPQDPR